jgi:hypothetical protein
VELITVLQTGIKRNKPTGMKRIKPPESKLKTHWIKARLPSKETNVGLGETDDDSKAIHFLI